MTVNEFLTSYKSFVVDAGFTINSAHQYVSYLRNVCKKLPGIETKLEQIATSDDVIMQSMYAEELNVAISKELKKVNSNVSLKKLRDYKSAVNVLVAFLSGNEWEKNQGPTIKPKLDCDSEYSRNDLRKIFLSRLKTQDRMSYSYGVFAARILCKIATANKVKLFNKMAENVKFIYSINPQRFFKLKEINKLIIAVDGFAYVECKGKVYPIYTAVYKNGKHIGFEKANITMARYLSLDHDKPMVEALEKQLLNMPEYKKLSDDIMRFKNTYKGNISKLSIDYYNGEYKNLLINETKILEEMGTFLDSLQLTIMHSSYNSSKNKN